MDAGTTFVLARDQQIIDDHLWVVLSDTTAFADKVVIVSFTSNTPEKDQACTVEKQEHSWLRHSSCISYAHAKVVTLAGLLRWKDSGLIVLQEPVSAPLLARIRQRSGDSATLIPEIADILIEQRLIRLDD